MKCHALPCNALECAAERGHVGGVIEEEEQRAPSMLTGRWMDGGWEEDKQKSTPSAGKVYPPACMLHL
jgi:hypothetical protein